MTHHLKNEAPKKTGIRMSLRSRERGSSLVELAFVLAFLLTMVFGIVDFGRALYTYHFVSNAAREATRWASVRGRTSTLPGGWADNTNVQTLVKNVSGMGLDPTKITATTSWPITSFSSPTCGATPNNPGCVVEVQVQYEYDFLFPFLRIAPLTMTSTSQMVISQ
jgi:Flp pilus assembly protein TadG